MKFKTPEVQNRFSDLCAMAQTIATEMDVYAKEKYNVGLTITATVSTAEEDKELNRVSDTHRTRRAFDIRTGDLPSELVDELCAVFSKKYGRYGAVNTAIPQLIIHKPHGSGPHLHVQLSRKYALKEIDYGKES